MTAVLLGALGLIAAVVWWVVRNLAGNWIKGDWYVDG